MCGNGERKIMDTSNSNPEAWESHKKNVTVVQLPEAWYKEKSRVSDSDLKCNKKRQLIPHAIPSL